MTQWLWVKVFDPGADGPWFSSWYRTSKFVFIATHYCMHLTCGAGAGNDKDLAVSFD